MRFEVPLYTVAEAARVLAVPLSTFPPLGARLRTPASRRASAWLRANGLVDEHTNSGLAIPFVGLAEDMVLPAIRRANVPPQRVRPALDVLRNGLGIGHALASRRLFTGKWPSAPRRTPAR